ncbi:MAG: creatininase family protein [Tabrizicola sp.]|nr:creatininase family protein [Tabrizicola sp.]
MTLKHRFWADYTARDFAALDREALIAVLPVGAVEQHGPHLPLSVDRDILDGIIAAAIPLIPGDCPVLFLPTCAIGKSNEHAAWPGTLSLSATTLMAMWSDIGASVARAGVRKLVILNAHGGQIAPMDIVARDLRVTHGIVTVAANWFAMGLPEGILPAEEERFGIHAGELETSMMLALRPDLVAMAHARNFPARQAELAGHLGLAPAGRLGWQMQDLNAAGACGNAAAATADKGRAFIDHAAAQLVALLGEVQRLPHDWLETSPDPDAFA